MSKNQFEKITVLLFDNAAIHKTKNVKLRLKKLNLVAFTFPTYSPEINKVELVLGTLKTIWEKKSCK